MESITPLLESAVSTHDAKAYAEQFAKQDYLVIDNFLPAHFVVQNYLPEVENCTKYIHRVNIPGFKKSGSVSYHDIQKYAPLLFSIYKNTVIKHFIETIVGTEIYFCPENDQHAAALYYYTEPGDRINKHYDKSFYRGKRFTVLLGMIQDSVHSKLVCYPGATKLSKKTKNILEVATHPGTLVIFNGDTLWHEVTALGENEKRVILTLEYVTDTRMSLLNKLVSNFKDRFLYFGKNQYQQT